MRNGIAILMGLLYITVLPAFAQQPVASPSFTLKSNNFSNQQTLPVDYTCDGKNISPELKWNNAPNKTLSYTLILSDPDAPNGTFYHWVIYNIPNTVNELTEGQSNLPTDAVAIKNSWNSTEYRGACPPKGNTHQYIFTLYALDIKLTLATDADVQTVMNAMQDHILTKAELKTSYGH